MTVVADIRMTCGQLYEAYRSYEHALHLLTELSGSTLIGVEDIHRGSLSYIENGTS